MGRRLAINQSSRPWPGGRSREFPMMSGAHAWEGLHAIAGVSLLGSLEVRWGELEGTVEGSYSQAVPP